MSFPLGSDEIAVARVRWCLNNEMLELPTSNLPKYVWCLRFQLHALDQQQTLLIEITSHGTGLYSMKFV